MEVLLLEVHSIESGDISSPQKVAFSGPKTPMDNDMLVAFLVVNVYAFQVYETLFLYPFITLLPL